MGAEFIRALGKQKIVFTRDRRSQVEQVARGAYMIGLGVSNVDAKPFIDAGAPFIDFGTALGFTSSVL